jgi:hypothetical protein
MEATCPSCYETNLIFLHNNPIRVLKNGVECSHCESKISFKIFGNKAIVIKDKPVVKQPKMRFVINKPIYQMRNPSYAI